MFITLLKSRFLLTPFLSFSPGRLCSNFMKKIEVTRWKLSKHPFLWPQNEFLSSPVIMFLHGVQEEDISLPFPRIASHLCFDSMSLCFDSVILYLYAFSDIPKNGLHSRCRLYMEIVLNCVNPSSERVIPFSILL